MTLAVMYSNHLTKRLITMIIFSAWTTLTAIVIPYSISAQSVKNGVETIKMSVQKRIPSDLDPGAYIIVNEIQEWVPQETAIITTDMWDKHWCTGATQRVAEMAPYLNEVFSVARDNGMLIVHAPSDCMAYYKDHPGRKLAQKYHSKKFEKMANGDPLESEKNAIWPIDQSDDGCDDSQRCKSYYAWTKQVNTLEIKEIDVISDSGAELAALFEKRGIKNVILTGVHTNMCVIGRTFGLRSMVRLEKNVVLMRDLTDGMYNSGKWPFVNHFTGVDLMVEYIEKYVCPTILSSDITGQKRFRFNEDKRPIVAFITAEGEYRANQRLPEFAHHLMVNEGVACEFAIGKPAMDGPGRHNIENLRVLDEADLAVFFVRRVALEPAKMELVKNYAKRGKPILGIRTASHAFDAKGNVPREGGSIGASAEQVGDFLAQWPEFDQEVLGGNYQGHYGHLETLTKIAIVPGMESHPLLKGIPSEGFGSPNWLYKNRPLRSEHAQVLLTGTIPGERPEPVLWAHNKVVYTSLGHWDDWEIEGFHKLMVNSVNYLLDRGN